MSFRTITAFMAVLVSLSGTVAAQEATTVQSLVKQDFAIVGVTTSLNGGAGVFLQKKDQVFYCFAAETPTSPTLATRYCKPVQ